ncbi:alpha/beta hydrolase [Myceligenerans crystallogenes]|uniref:Alpha/beta hydrolase n=1 Tax=Myceligenerans crystallogenes TaxID=316335 RepID=A0ABN2N2I1_9MICO
MFAEVEGVKLHHVVHGPEDPGAPTAVLIHGFGVDHRLMAGAYEPVFAERPGWRRIYLDLPGMGRTVAPESVAGTDDVFRVLRAAVDELVPGPYTVIGQSYGGLLARGLAAAHDRVEGIGLVVPVIEAEHARRVVPDRQVLVREPALVDEVGDAALDADDDIHVVQTRAVLARFAAEIAPGLSVVDQRAVDRISAAYAGTFPLEPRPFGGPGLFVVGRQDHVTGYRQAWDLLEHYPRTTFAVVDRAGHHVHLESRAVFEALVHEWLDRVEESRSA